MTDQFAPNLAIAQVPEHNRVIRPVCRGQDIFTRREKQPLVSKKLVRYYLPRFGVRDVPDLKSAFRLACAFVGHQIIARGGNDPDGSAIWIQEDLHSPPRLRLPNFVPLGSIDRQTPAVPRGDDLLS